MFTSVKQEPTEQEHQQQQQQHKTQQSQQSQQIDNEAKIKMTSNKSKRARRDPVSSVARRNERERNRVRLVNLGFATLRNHVPTLAQVKKSKKMSKVETLRAAIEHIARLRSLIHATSGGNDSIFASLQIEPSRCYSRDSTVSTSSSMSMFDIGSNNDGDSSESSNGQSSASQPMMMHHQYSSQQQQQQVHDTPVVSRMNLDMKMASHANDDPFASDELELGLHDHFGSNSNSNSKLYTDNESDDIVDVKNQQFTQHCTQQSSPQQVYEYTDLTYATNTQYNNHRLQQQFDLHQTEQQLSPIVDGCTNEIYANSTSILTPESPESPTAYNQQQHHQQPMINYADHHTQIMHQLHDQQQQHHMQQQQQQQQSNGHQMMEQMMQQTNGVYNQSTFNHHFHATSAAH